MGFNIQMEEQKLFYHFDRLLFRKAIICHNHLSQEMFTELQSCCCLVCVLLRLSRMSEKSRKEKVKIDRLHWIQMVSFSTSFIAQSLDVMMPGVPVTFLFLACSSETGSVRLGRSKREQ